MKDVKKSTISGVSKWDLYKTNAQGFHEGNRVGNEDGHTMSSTNVNEQTKCCMI